MKIMTLNTWQERGPWPERWEVIFRGIEELRPDVIAFQEVFNPAWMRTVQKRSGYFSLVVPGDGHTGLGILSRYPLIRFNQMQMKTKSPTEPYFRYALFAEFNTGKGSVLIFNTHLSWRIPESHVRLKQVEELLEFIRENAGDREGFVMGDFNAKPEAEEIKFLLKKGCYTDTYAKLHPQKQGISWSHSNPYSLEAARLDACYPLPERRIDYIFMTKDTPLMTRLKSMDIIFNKADPRGYWASDHFGLLATIEEQ